MPTAREEEEEDDEAAAVLGRSESGRGKRYVKVEVKVSVDRGVSAIPVRDVADEE